MKLKVGETGQKNKPFFVNIEDDSGWGYAEGRTIEEATLKALVQLITDHAEDISFAKSSKKR